MTWPQAFFYCFLALLTAPVVYAVVILVGVQLCWWADDGFWPFNRKTKSAKKLADALRDARKRTP